MGLQVVERPVNHPAYTKHFTNMAPIVPLSFHLGTLVTLAGFQAHEFVLLLGSDTACCVFLFIRLIEGAAMGSLVPLLWISREGPCCPLPTLIKQKVVLRGAGPRVTSDNPAHSSSLPRLWK